MDNGSSILMPSEIVVRLMEDQANPLLGIVEIEKAPSESFADIGGLESQIKEIKEAVSLSLMHPEIFEKLGIALPNGILLWGEPGTGKTLLAKATANEASATFLKVAGSEIIKNHLGEGPELVRELFRIAEKHIPCVIFIDEVDALGPIRYDSHSSDERQIIKTMLELLNQLDNLDSKARVKVIMSTNKLKALDPIILRPGRLDRRIEFPRQRRRFFRSTQESCLWLKM